MIRRIGHYLLDPFELQYNGKLKMNPILEKPICLCSNQWQKEGIIMIVDQLMKDAISLYWGIAIGCFIVHYQFFSDEIKTV